MATIEDLDSGTKVHLSPTADELEEMFKTRYSAEDEEYTAYVNTPACPPPVVDNWYSRPKRHYDYTRGGNRDSRSGGDRYNRDHGNQYRQDRDNRGYRDNRGQGYYDQGRQDYRDRSYDRHGGYRDNRHDRYGDDRRHYQDRDRNRSSGRPLYAGLRPDEY